jgi:hypothetical protein
MIPLLRLGLNQATVLAVGEETLSLQIEAQSLKH